VRDIIREGAGDRKDLPGLSGRCSECTEHLEVFEQRAKKGVEGLSARVCSLDGADDGGAT
jgi:hypothetical protein